MSFRIELEFLCGAKFGNTASVKRIGCTGWLVKEDTDDFRPFPDKSVALLPSDDNVGVSDGVATVVVNGSWTIFKRFGRALKFCFGCDSFSKNRTKAWANPSLL